jgi:hypothetical protein
MRHADIPIKLNLYCCSFYWPEKTPFNKNVLKLKKMKFHPKHNFQDHKSTDNKKSFFWQNSNTKRDEKLGKFTRWENVMRWSWPRLTFIRLKSTGKKRRRKIFFTWKLLARRMFFTISCFLTARAQLNKKNSLKHENAFRVVWMNKKETLFSVGIYLCMNRAYSYKSPIKSAVQTALICSRKHNITYNKLLIQTFAKNEENMRKYK